MESRKLYEQQVVDELVKWQQKMLSKPSLFDRFSKKIQDRINSWIPEKVHKAITTGIKQMFRLVLFGAGYTTGVTEVLGPLELKEAIIKERINFYKKTAAAEGGITGAGGILSGLADFPLLMGIKIKMLFDIAALYGFDIKDYRERLYILFIFQLAFSSHQTRKEVYLNIADWQQISVELPTDIHQYDWRKFQQEYRDYIDLAKMAQMVPVIGAPVGAIANYSLVKKLGITAMNAYRMRLSTMGKIAPSQTNLLMQ